MRKTPCLKLLFCVCIIFLHTNGYGQKKPQPFFGVHLGAEPEMYFIGPSVMGGVDLPMSERWLISAYAAYFRVGKRSDPDLPKEIYSATTVSLLMERGFGRTNRDGFFAGAGVAFHKIYIKNGAFDIFGTRTGERLWIPAIRLGHKFPLKNNILAVEFNGMGPYNEKTDNSSYTEILAHLNIGVRYIFD